MGADVNTMGRGGDVYTPGGRGGGQTYIHRVQMCIHGCKGTYIKYRCTSKSTNINTESACTGKYSCTTDIHINYYTNYL